MNENLIPLGNYCYSHTGTTNELGIPNIKLCPNFTYREIMGVKLPFCSLLNKGSIPNGLTDEEFEKLLNFYKSEDELYEDNSLSLLWDHVKECGLNYDEF